MTSAPKFVTGSLLRHILVMTATSGLGLMAIFLGDLANIFFLSLLADESIVAAVGYASSILFLTISIGIGLGIAATALVSTALGAKKYLRAKRMSVNAHLWTLVVSIFLSILVWVLMPWMLDLLGAKGHTKTLAERYLTILIPALPPLAVAMTSAAILRSLGDARRAMNVTLYGAVANIILDPIFIFALGLGLEGAAISTALARIVILLIGLHGIIVIHKFYAPPNLKSFLSTGTRLGRVAVPAITTNIATPFANAFVTSQISIFGDSAVAGWAVIGRILPVAFASIYALSASVGPIIGQNYGARNQERMQETIKLALWVSTAFTLIAWFALAITAPLIVTAFKATGEAAGLILLFCRWLAPLHVFLSALFISNAVFNTLGRPHYATALNWARATIGTIPFTIVGGHIAGSHGALTGFFIGTIAFGILAAIWCDLFIKSFREPAPQKR